MGQSICVFCASSSGLPEVYRRAARELGAELARRGHRLVYGGGKVGLMGELARSVHEHGGRIFGAIPRTLVDRELAYGPADELVVTDTLRDHNDTFSSTTGRTTAASASTGSAHAAVLGRQPPGRAPTPGRNVGSQPIQ